MKTSLKVIFSLKAGKMNDINLFVRLVCLSAYKNTIQIEDKAANGHASVSSRATSTVNRVDNK